VTKTYPTKHAIIRAVDNLTLDIADRELAVLVGPSGCGKTTTLRLLAGLEVVSAGRIRIGGRVMENVPPKDRNIAMVFQHDALYPHMTVFRNMAFGLKMRRLSRTETTARVREAARLLGLEHLLERKPAALSGGERQRVALGRAIVRRPRVFLFDEPLSSLDAQLRIQMRTELKSLHARLQTTMIYVTHDQQEAMTLGDRIVVMEDGIVRQCGTPLEVYRQPTCRFVAGFIGTPAMNFLSGRLEHDGKEVMFVTGTSRLPLPPAVAKAVTPHGNRSVVLGVRSEHLRLDGSESTPSSGPNAGRQGTWATLEHVIVRMVEPLGDSMNAHLATGTGEPLIARLAATASVTPSDRVHLLIDMSNIHLFADDNEGRRLF
jgi:multiple sugar transport system ATP-binding protein